MNFSSMKRPQSRAEFERNFDLLHKQIGDGKFHVPRGFVVDSLERVRSLPNGRLDFLSVDENARLQANTVAQFNEEFFMEKLKEVNNSKSSTSDVDDGIAQKIGES